LRVALGSWLALIMASTVLTHQHHLIDIAAALVLVGAIHLASEAKS
jgi:membrane-associated phospholipid phosphatase